MSIFIIAEIGINHNGDINIAKKIIEGARNAGANAVKFQKRTINKVYDKKTLDSYRDSPWGKTVREQKEGLELKEKDYDEINKFCSSLDISWFASSWDIDSQVFLRKYNLKYNKVASAMLTHLDLLNEIAKEKNILLFLLECTQ